VPTSDQQLIDEFLAGSTSAVAVIDAWIARAATPYRRRLWTQWDDVLQSARLEITRLLRRDSFRGESSLKTYLWQAVNHVCIDYLRKCSRAPAVELEELLDQPDKHNDSPFDVALQNESRVILRRVLAAMPVECRELWQMIIAGLSYQEMSEQRGVAAATLRVRVLRCRKSAALLREQMLTKKIL
jgi:RNA polymerase sigma factor (sigma-70 family)